MTKFLTELNLNGNQLQNAVIHPLATAPANPIKYQIYTNSTDNIIYQYDGTAWNPVGAVYNQGSATGAVITGLGKTGTVTTTDVINLTLTGYTPVEQGYISADDTIEAALQALDTAVKNAVAGGGEVNQNAWSNITVPAPSTGTGDVVGSAATIEATAKTDTFTLGAGNKWIAVKGDATNKTITIGHRTSGATAGTYGAANKVPSYTIDAAGHITSVSEITITPAAIGADVAGAASNVLGVESDASSAATVYGARALAQEALDAAELASTEADAKVASVGAGNASVTIGGTTVAPTVAVKLDPATDNAIKLGTNGLKVTIPDASEYSVVKAATAETGFTATYHLTKDGTNVGASINIPKDYLVKSASVKTAGASDPSGFPEGTKYIDFVVNTYDTSAGPGTESHIYLNVADLVDVYTAGDGITVGADNIISAKVVAGNGLSVDDSGIKMATVVAGGSAGAMTGAMATKLAGIDTGATNNTITLNGTETKTPSFYAPTNAGTKGQVLISNGSGAPTWQPAPESVHKYTGINGALTASGGAWSWTIPATTHGIDNNAILTQVYEVATGEQVIVDISVNATSYLVTITINDTAGAGSLAAGTYRAVLLG